MEPRIIAKRRRLRDQLSWCPRQRQLLTTARLCGWILFLYIPRRRDAVTGGVGVSAFSPTSSVVLYRPCMDVSASLRSSPPTRTLLATTTGDPLEEDNNEHSPPLDSSNHCSDRRAAIVFLASTVLLPMVAANAAEVTTTTPPLESLSVGQGQWLPLTTKAREVSKGNLSDELCRPPSNFCTYATRFLIRYDSAVQAWWQSQQQQVSLLSPTEQRTRLSRAFGSLAKSLEQAVEDQVNSSFNSAMNIQKQQQFVYRQLWNSFERQYGQQPDAIRQLRLMFALLPPSVQPVQQLLQGTGESQASSFVSTSFRTNNSGDDLLEQALNQDLSTLLPEVYTAQKQQQTSDKSTIYFQIEPPVPLFEVGIGEEFGQTATATTFGPLALTPLTRERPVYGWPIYALFGLSGASGCAITHSIVIPLDVVKTKAQTDPEQFANRSVLAGGRKILRDEGLQGLLLGSQATVAGYFWYGLSVYPSYSFFKRFLTTVVLAPEMATAHADWIALVAGALAAVVASLGLTPLEAARIRAVAEPAVYQPLGLSGTLALIAKEDPLAGWKALYAGLPSLLTRQVIFGSVKFLAFERACEFIFGVAPFLRDATWTALGVSLIAGGFSGTLSSVVSQPADSVLTFVAKNSDGEGRSNLGVLEGSRIMVEQEGLGSLFRGLGSRCVWAGSIIAGQFLLYDVFRTYFHITQEDLSQVFHIVLPETT